MKYFIAFFFYASISVNAQSPFQLGVSRLQLPGGFALTADHGYIIGGNMLDTLSGLSDVYALVKIDSLGNEQWASMYFDAGHDSWISSLFQSADSNYVFSGYPDGLINHVCVIAKVNSNGQVIWKRELNLPGYESASASHCLETNDGCYAIAFNQYDYIPHHYFTSLLKLNSNGNLLWEKNFLDTINNLGKINSIETTNDNGFILTGQNLNNSYYTYLIRTDSFGNPLWYKIYDIPANNVPGTSVKQTLDHGFIITSSDLHYGGNANIIKTDSVGDIQWTTTLSGNEYHLLTSIEQCSDSNYIITGTIGNFNNNTQRLLLVKIDQAGDTLWTRTYQSGGGINLCGRKIMETSDHGLVSFNQWFYTSQILKTDSNGFLNCDQSYSITTVQHNTSFVINGILAIDSIQGIANGFMGQNYYPPSTSFTCAPLNATNEEFIYPAITISPNPVSGKLLVISNDEIVSTTVFSLLGKNILTNIKKSEIDITSLTKGIYFIQVQTEFGFYTMKFIKQ